MLPIFLFSQFTKAVAKGYPNSKIKWRKRSFINAKKSSKFPTQNPCIKSYILDLNFYILCQILTQLNLTSMTLEFIKIVKSFAQLSHTAEILFSSVIKHKIKLSVLLYVKPTLFDAIPLLKKKERKKVWF